MTVPTVYTMPPSLPFADTLAGGLLKQYESNPLGLSAVEIYLPNRRICQTVSESFLKLSDGKVTLLPKLTPIGDVDLDEFTLNDFGHDLTITEPIPKLKRQFMLAQLIMARGDIDLSLEQALNLADELARLIDQIHTENLSADNLENLVPEQFANHWKITIDFLSIIIKKWPDILGEAGFCDPSAYRNTLLKIKTENLRNNPPTHPIIAAGSTGSIPATANLLHAIATLPNGCVILPGLDIYLDDESWQQLQENHPQYNLKNLIETINVVRKTIIPWPHATKPDIDPKTQKRLDARERLISEVTRPAETSQKWNALKLDPHCIDGLSQIDTQTPQEESLTIALMMREVLEHHNKTAMLVTPDRDLSYRVSADLKRWSVEIYDSEGTVLSQKPVGHFLNLISLYAAQPSNVFIFLELLKHPLCCFGMQGDEYNETLQILEKDILRGPKLNGLNPIKSKIKTLSDEEDRQKCEMFIEKVETILNPLIDLTQNDLDTYLKAHITAAESLSQTPDEDGTNILWRAEDGEAAATLFTDLLQTVNWNTSITAQDYSGIINTTMAQINVRPKYRLHPRLKILSPIEARLQSADLIILGGLNEGSWPLGSQNDPWMSRPMRQQFGLPGLEKKIGLSAHDFCQFFCAPHVFLTRSKNKDGAQTVPSRWLMRLETVLQQAKIENIITTAIPYQIIAQHIDDAKTVTPCNQPHPTPPVDKRPTKLSVTQIETWIRDPYSIYARKILDLHKLDELEENMDRRDWGTYVHDVLDRFIEQKHNMTDGDALQKLLDIAATHLETLPLRDDQKTSWSLRFQNIAAWFIDHEKNQQPNLKKTASEKGGGMQIGDFILTARADRIDHLNDNTLSLIDYKTGSVPTPKDIRRGYAPQLPLMAMIAENGEFDRIPKAQVSKMVYYKLSGKQNKAGAVTDLENLKGITTQDLISQTRDRLKDMIDHFAKEETPYWSIPNFDARPGYNDYEHLARVAEWSAGQNDPNENTGTET